MIYCLSYTVMLLVACPFVLVPVPAIINVFPSRDMVIVPVETTLPAFMYQCSPAVGFWRCL